MILKKNNTACHTESICFRFHFTRRLMNILSESFYSLEIINMFACCRKHSFIKFQHVDGTKLHPFLYIKTTTEKHK